MLTTLAKSSRASPNAAAAARTAGSKSRRLCRKCAAAAASTRPRAAAAASPPPAFAPESVSPVPPPSEKDAASLVSRAVSARSASYSAITISYSCSCAGVSGATGGVKVQAELVEAVEPVAGAGTDTVVNNVSGVDIAPACELVVCLFSETMLRGVMEPTGGKGHVVEAETEAEAEAGVELLVPSPRCCWCRCCCFFCCCFGGEELTKARAAGFSGR